MGKFVCRLAVVITSALVPMAFVVLVTPTISSADCDNGWWWDPMGNVCRPLVPLDCDNGWWWDPVANVCRPPVVPTPLACDDGWWWDPASNVCRPPLIP